MGEISVNDNLYPTRSFYATRTRTQVARAVLWVGIDGAGIRPGPATYEIHAHLARTILSADRAAPERLSECYLPLVSAATPTLPYRAWASVAVLWYILTAAETEGFPEGAVIKCFGQNGELETITYTRLDAVGGTPTDVYRLKWVAEPDPNYKPRQAGKRAASYTGMAAH